MAFGLGSILTGLIGGSLLGSKNKGGRSIQQGGYAALPPHLQALYDQFGSVAKNAVPENIYGSNRVTQAPRPITPFDSRELYALQQALGAQNPTNPIGVLEPFSEYQRNALQSYGQPDFSKEGLSQYMLPFQDAQQRALQNINRQTDMAAAGVRGREAGIGSLARDALYGGQYPQIEEARARAIGDLESNITQQALGLRNQSLSDMFRAGGAIQGQNQALLNTANPSQLATLSPDYGRVQAMMQLLAGIPQSSMSETTPVSPNMFGRIANAGNFLFGNQIANTLGYNRPQFGGF